MAVTRDPLRRYDDGVRRVVRDAQAIGAALERGGKHYVLRFPNGSKVPVPRGRSYSRIAARFAAQVRKAFDEVGS